MYRAIPSGLGRHLDQMRGPEATTADIYDDTTVAAALFRSLWCRQRRQLLCRARPHHLRCLHLDAAARVARLTRASGAERLIHVSGIGADSASSVPYIASRGRGEITVRQSFPDAIVIRPAVMFQMMSF